MAAKQVLKLSSVQTAFGVTLNCLTNWRKRETNPLPVIKRGHFVFVEPAALQRWAKKSGKTFQSHKNLTELVDLPKDVAVKVKPKLAKLPVKSTKRTKRVH